MNTPAKLIFREWKKPEVVLTLHEWKPWKGLAVVLDGSDHKQVFELVLPGQLSKGALGTFVVFPSAQPKIITERPLLPPPCRSTQAEADNLVAKAREARTPRAVTSARKRSDLPDREVTWLRCRREVLVPKPEDDAEFSKRLEPLIAEKRQEYEARRQELEDWRTKSFGEMFVLGGGRFYRDLGEPGSLLKRQELMERHEKWLEFQFLLPLRQSVGRPIAGYLNWTLDVARHEPVIRDPVLHERWAKGNGLELSEMRADKEAFLRWYHAHQLPSPPVVRTPEAGFLEALVSPEARLAYADEVLCAEVRYHVRFADDSRVWLTDCPLRQPLLTPGEQWCGENTSAKPAFTAGTKGQEHAADDMRDLHRKTDQLLTGNQRIQQTIADGNQNVIEAISTEGGATRKIIQQESAKVLSDTKTLKELAGEQAATRDKWAENPLGSREGSADYLLTMRAAGIKGERAAALVYFGYGETQEKCAAIAGVSVESIKRDLIKARDTQYAKFFARTRRQKLEALKAMKRPDDAFARMKQLAEEDPDKLRAMIDQMIAKAQKESGDGSAWENTVAGLS
ncbi:MAG: hypothetical protein WCH99_14530 [Verrucomicrobiota bacterium]